MWEDNSRSKLIKTILLAVAAVLLFVLFGYGVMLMKKNQAEENQELTEIYTQQLKEQEESNKSVLETVEAEYEKDIETVNEYMPGIVCWGDNLTAGSSGNASYPDALYDYIKEEIIDYYDFRQTLDDPDSITRITEKQWKKYKIDIPVINMGGGKENTDTVMGRQGSQPFVVRENFTIPADTESVSIKIANPYGGTVTPLLQNDTGVNRVEICGISGTLSRDNTGSYYFTRYEAGQETEVEKETEIITSATGMYKNYIPVIWVGSNEDFYSQGDLVEKIQTMLNYQEQAEGRYIVIGNYQTCSGNYDYVQDASTKEENALQSAFGERFINLRKYLASDAIYDANLDPQESDLKAMEKGYAANSLITESGELTSVAYELVGKLVYERMDKLGYFDEIIEECGIEEQRELALKK